MSARREPKPAALCVLRIGFEDYLLPADDGMKVASLMAKAEVVDRSLGSTGRGGLQVNARMRGYRAAVGWEAIDSRDVLPPVDVVAEAPPAAAKPARPPRLTHGGPA